MFVTLVHRHVKPEHLDAFLGAARGQPRGLEREAGNLRFDVIRSSTARYRILLYEWFRDEAAALRHRDKPHYFAWRGATADHFVEPRQGVQGCLRAARRRVPYGPYEGAHAERTSRSTAATTIPRPAALRDVHAGFEALLRGRRCGTCSLSP